MEAVSESSFYSLVLCIPGRHLAPNICLHTCVYLYLCEMAK